MFPGAELVATLIYFFILAIIIRVVLSYFPGMLYTEFGRLLARGTDWFLDPIRRVLPPLGGMDFSPFVAILLLYALRALIISGDIVGAIFGIVESVLQLMVLILVIRVLFSFFRMDPFHPLVQMIVRASEPFARPFRRWFPKRSGQFDWAPVAAGVALLLVLILVYQVQAFTPRPGLRGIG
ncbi:MAG TPA: YggT family protein [Candidatus Dormibacteraeota bacterium]|jgi:YggT family protein